MINKTNIETKALYFSLAGSILFATLGLGFALITNSQAILLDGIWDLLAVLLGLIAIKVSKIINQPPSKNMPLGYAAYEPLYMLLKGLIGLGLTAFIIIKNLIILINGGNPLSPGPVVVYISIAIVGNLFIYFVLRRLSKNIHSPTLNVEKESWLVNLLISSSVGAAFIFVFLFKDGFLQNVYPYIDQIITIGVGLFTITIPTKQIVEGLKDLLLVAPNLPEKEKLLEIIDQSIEQSTIDRYRPLFSKTGRKIWITMLIKPKLSTVTSIYSDNLKSRLEKALKPYVNYVQVDVILTESTI